MDDASAQGDTITSPAGELVLVSEQLPVTAPSEPTTPPMDLLPAYVEAPEEQTAHNR